MHRHESCVAARIGRSRRSEAGARATQRRGRAVRDQVYGDPRTPCRRHHEAAAPQCGVDAARSSADTASSARTRERVLPIVVRLRLRAACSRRNCTRRVWTSRGGAVESRSRPWAISTRSRGRKPKRTARTAATGHQRRCATDAVMFGATPSSARVVKHAMIRGHQRMSGGCRVIARGDRAAGCARARQSMRAARAARSRFTAKPASRLEIVAAARNEPESPCFAGPGSSRRTSGDPCGISCRIMRGTSAVHGDREQGRALLDEEMPALDQRTRVHMEVCRTPAPSLRAPRGPDRPRRQRENPALACASSVRKSSSGADSPPSSQTRACIMDDERVHQRYASSIRRRGTKRGGGASAQISACRTPARLRHRSRRPSSCGHARNT